MHEPRVTTTPTLLAIDTATEACSCALLHQGQLIERHIVMPRGHAEQLLPMVDALLAESGVPLAALEAIAVTRGPGAFTGVRIAVSLAQGLAFGLDVPVVPVSTLAVMAHGARALARQHGASLLVPALDARMSELYLAAWRLDEDTLEPVQADCLVPPAACQWPWLDQPWLALGHGWDYLPAMPSLPRPPVAVERDWLPRASWLAERAAQDWAAGVRVPAEQLEPVYLRDQVAWAAPSALSAG